jgi:hypothetical protein
MRVSILTMAALMAWGPSVSHGSDSASELSVLVGKVQVADYRGARADLRQLADALESSPDPGLAFHRHYWRGFALWRRALNGFNETPTPDDLAQDLRTAIASFRAALREQPDAIEPQIGMVGCWSSLLFLTGQDKPAFQAVLADYVPVAQSVRERGAKNPRALWLLGGTQLAAPPPYGGDAVKAAATYRQGIDAALEEARQASGQPRWVPSWGGAENLMSLAYLYSHSSLANRDLALAYAEGALVAAPEWHYVRDILRPQIQALPEPAQR